jgi:hypothetical protein
MKRALGSEKIVPRKLWQCGRDRTDCGGLASPVSGGVKVYGEEWVEKVSQEKRRDWWLLARITRARRSEDGRKERTSVSPVSDILESFCGASTMG